MQAVQPIGQQRVQNTRDLKRFKFLDVIKHFIIPIALVMTITLGVFLPMGFDMFEDTPPLYASVNTLQAQAVYMYYKPGKDVPTEATGEGTYVGISDGSDVSMIGDSITAMSTSEILKLLPNADVDGISGTFIDKVSPQEKASGLDRLKSLVSSGKLRDILVFAMGTNKDYNTVEQLQEKLDKVLASAGNDHKIIFMTYIASGGKSGWDYSSFSQAIRDYASVHSNVSVMDWEKAVKDTGNVSGLLPVEKGMFAYVHPSGVGGTQLFAKTVQDAVNERTDMKKLIGGSTGATGAGTYPGDALEAKIWNYFVSLNIPGVSDNPECIAGIIGNFWVESGGLKPFIHGSGYGLYQVTSGSGYLNDFLSKVNPKNYGARWNDANASEDVKIKFSYATIDYLVASPAWGDFMKCINRLNGKTGADAITAYTELFMVAVENCPGFGQYLQDQTVIQILNDRVIRRNINDVWQGRNDRVNSAKEIYGRYLAATGGG